MHMTKTYRLHGLCGHPVWSQLEPNWCPQENLFLETHLKFSPRFLPVSSPSSRLKLVGYVTVK